MPLVDNSSSSSSLVMSPSKMAKTLGPGNPHPQLEFRRKPSTEARLKATAFELQTAWTPDFHEINQILLNDVGEEGAALLPLYKPEKMAHQQSVRTAIGSGTPNGVGEISNGTLNPNNNNNISNINEEREEEESKSVEESSLVPQSKHEKIANANIVIEEVEVMKQTLGRETTYKQDTAIVAAPLTSSVVVAGSSNHHLDKIPSALRLPKSSQPGLKREVSFQSNVKGCTDDEKIAEDIWGDHDHGSHSSKSNGGASNLARKSHTGMSASYKQDSSISNHMSIINQGGSIGMSKMVRITAQKRQTELDNIFTQTNKGDLMQQTTAQTSLSQYAKRNPAANTVGGDPMAICGGGLDIEVMRLGEDVMKWGTTGGKGIFGNIVKKDYNKKEPQQQHQKREQPTSEKSDRSLIPKDELKLTIISDNKETQPPKAQEPATATPPQTPVSILKSSLANKGEQRPLLSLEKQNAAKQDGDNAPQDEDSERLKQRYNYDFDKMTTLTSRITSRQSRGNLAHWYILYPGDLARRMWEFVSTMQEVIRVHMRLFRCIIVTCLLTPYFLAFPDSYTTAPFVIDQIVNLCFGIDLIVQFFMAYFDEDFQIVDSIKVIAWKYGTSWFFIDFFSTIPFDLLFNVSNINKISRFTRIGKISKLIRLTRIVRIAKIAKVSNKLVKHLSQILKIGASTERLIFLLLSFFALQHVCSCLWIFVARYDEQSKINWIYQRNYLEIDDFELYVTSFYFTVTTLVTVGYGDISAFNTAEKFLCIFLMIIGVFVFSFTTGSLSSIITSYDSKEAELKEKIITLNEIADDYMIETELFTKLVRTIKYDHSKKNKDTIAFMEELPHKLKLELALTMINRMYANIAFFKNKEKSFIAWVARLIRPMNVEDSEYIYKEGEEIAEIYFLNKGNAGYVLPRFYNKIYVFINEGEHFGHTDLGQDVIFMEALKSNKRVVTFDKEQLIRRFTVQAIGNCDILSLSIKDLLKMKLEFPKIFTVLFEDVRKRLKIELGLKIELIRKQEEDMIDKENSKNKLRSKFKINLLGGLQSKMREDSETDTPVIGGMGKKIGTSLFANLGTVGNNKPLALQPTFGIKQDPTSPKEGGAIQNVNFLQPTSFGPSQESSTFLGPASGEPAPEQTMNQPAEDRASQMILKLKRALTNNKKDNEFDKDVNKPQTRFASAVSQAKGVQIAQNKDADMTRDMSNQEISANWQVPEDSNQLLPENADMGISLPTAQINADEAILLKKSVIRQATEKNSKKKKRMGADTIGRRYLRLQTKNGTSNKSSVVWTDEETSSLTSDSDLDINDQKSQKDPMNMTSGGPPGVSIVEQKSGQTFDNKSHKSYKSAIKSSKMTKELPSMQDDAELASRLNDEPSKSDDDEENGEEEEDEDEDLKNEDNLSSEESEREGRTLLGKLMGGSSQPKSPFKALLPKSQLTQKSRFNNSNGGRKTPAFRSSKTIGVRKKTSAQFSTGTDHNTGSSSIKESLFQINKQQKRNERMLLALVNTIDSMRETMTLSIQTVDKKIDTLTTNLNNISLPQQQQQQEEPQPPQQVD